MQPQLNILKEELKKQLEDIIQYWALYTQDEQHGGFWGSINNQNQPVAGAPKGLVLNARILWTFSQASRYLNDKKILAISRRAFQYISDHFLDKEYGGVFWSVDENGSMLEGRKQIYGQAFCLYGMSAYYAATANPLALSFAKSLYALIEKYSYDESEKGYIEAFSRSWEPLDDLRLSEKDANEKKTMNTHLHIIEAYAALYKIWPDPGLKNKMSALLELIDRYFINHQSGHLRLFFDEHWNERIDVISYGHDIEAGWLLQQCAEITGEEKWIHLFKKNAIKLTNAAIRGLDSDGALWYEFDQHQQKMIKEKHWWPQAEAMIGFFNAWQLTGEETYLKLCFSSWAFIKEKLMDKTNGEWYWGILEDNSIMESMDKAGFWKCPYHNGRACMELIERIGFESGLNMSNLTTINV
jgi:mannobiose 2-epimerase